MLSDRAGRFADLVMREDSAGPALRFSDYRSMGAGIERRLLPSHPLGRGSMRLAALSLVVLVFVGCAEPRLARFDEAEYAPFAAVGSGTVVGQAFLKTRGGDVKYAAGCEVRLAPRTTVSEETYQREYLGGEKLEPIPAATLAKMRTYGQQVIGDGEGRFRFKAVPPGRYFIVTEITWEVPDPLTGTARTGGAVLEPLEVKGDETVEVVATRR